jgi:hypothetical protein
VAAQRLCRWPLEAVADALPHALPDGAVIELAIDDHRGLTARAQARVRIGVSTRDEVSLTYPIRWTPVGHSHLLPDFHGRLEVLALAEGSRLELSGRYKPPFGRLGTAMDRLTMGRRAGESLDDFLGSVVERIDACATDRAESRPIGVHEYPPDFRARSRQKQE